MRKYTLHTMTAAALAAALATPAFAQQTQQPQATSPMAQPPAASSTSSMPRQGATEQKAGFVQSQNANEWRASKLIGASVYGPDNSSIGEINDVLIGDNGEIRAVVVGVGGFLGVGEKDVALPFQALNIARTPDQAAIGKITVSYSKDELKNAPTFAYYQASKAQTTGTNAGNQPMNKSNTLKK